MKLISFLFILLFVQTGFSQSENENNPILTDRFVVSTGIFTPLKQIKLSANGSVPTEITDNIDFGKAFKLEGIQNSFIFDFMWRFSRNRKWSVSASFFKIGNENEAVLKEDIGWEDLVFRSGSKVKGGFGLSVYKIYFGRVISTGQQHELGGGLGLHILGTSAFIEGKAVINAGEDDETFKFEKRNVSVTLPLPNIGFWYFYTPAPRWALTARVDWFGLKIGDVKGTLWNLTPGVNYQILKNLGVSLNYKFLKIAADVEKKSWNGNFTMQFQGPSFTLTGNF